MQLKSAELQDQMNDIDRKIQEGVNLSSRNQLEADRNNLNEQLQVALEEEAQQARVQIQEEEVQAITLPYDFNELFSEEDHPITNANEIIIEVVKDTKRQANIEKNQALDEQKLAFTDRENSLQTKIEYMQKIIENGSQANNELTREIGEVRSYLQQVNLERDDAFNKRDAAFRQLEEANEVIKGLKIKLENMPSATTSFDINPSDKLAQMVKESLDEKVNRGLARWNIPVLATPDILPVNPVSEEEATTKEETFQSDQVQTAESGLVDQSLPLSGEEESQIDLDIEVVFTLEYVRQLRILEEKVALIESKLVA